jgi:hypothetical protein
MNHEKDSLTLITFFAFIAIVGGFVDITLDCVTPEIQLESLTRKTLRITVLLT